jgi:hypothetical protein
MKLPLPKLWRLRDIDRRLCLSDPRMAVMFALFARLNAGEAITSREQARKRATRLHRVLVALVMAAAGLTAAARCLFRRVVTRRQDAPIQRVQLFADIPEAEERSFCYLISAEDARRLIAYTAFQRRRAGTSQRSMQSSSSSTSIGLVM